MTVPPVREDRTEAPRSASSSSGCAIAAVVAVVVGLPVVLLLGAGALFFVWSSAPNTKMVAVEPFVEEALPAPKETVRNAPPASVAPARDKVTAAPPVAPPTPHEAKEPIATRAKQKTVDEWLAQLQDAEVGRRCEAARALREYGPEAKAAVPALTEALQEQNGDLRWQAVEALGAIGPEAKSAIPALTQMLKDTPSGTKGVITRTTNDGGIVRSEEASAGAVLAQALVKIDPQAALPALREYLRGQPQDVPNSLIEALGTIGPEAIPTLTELARTRTGATQRAAAIALGNIGRPAIPTLRELAQDKDKAVQRVAACGLGKLGAEALPIIKELLPETRFNVAVGLGWLKEEATATLLELLHDGDATVRRAAAVSLGHIRSRPGASPAPTAKASKDTGPAAVAKALVELLRDTDADVQWAAVHALGTMKSPESVAPLTKLLDAPEAVLRRDAATALGRMGPLARPAIPNLKALLQDRDARVCRAAEEALQKIEAAASASSFNPAQRRLVEGGPPVEASPSWPGTSQSLPPPVMPFPGGVQPGQPQRPMIVPPPVRQPGSTLPPPFGRR